MTELERALVALGRELDIPPEPDLRSRVRERIERRTRYRRAAVLALAVLVIAVGIALAVPPARSAILRFFHIGNETIEIVPTLPNAPHRSPIAGLAGPMSVEDATDRAGFNLILPPKHGGIYADDGIVATYIRPRVVLTEARGELGMSKKVASPQTRLEPVLVNDHSGMWISGAPHVVMYFDSQGRGREKRVRIAGNVLVWAYGSVTLRIEGPLTEAQALSLAASIR